MTGRYPLRYGLQTGVIPSSHPWGLPTDEWLLPQALKLRSSLLKVLRNRPYEIRIDTAFAEVMAEPRLHKAAGRVIEWMASGR